MMEGTQQPRRMRFSRCRLEVLNESGMSPPDAAARCGASRATGYRVWRRYRDGGWAALHDRASTPRRQPRRLSVGEEREMIALRQRTLAGPVVIAAITGRPASTVGEVLRRWGCSRLPKPERDHGSSLRAGAAGRALARGHEKAWPFPGGRQAHPERSGEAKPARRLAASAHRYRRSHAAGLRRSPGRPGQAGLRRIPPPRRGWYAQQGIQIERVLSDNAK